MLIFAPTVTVVTVTVTWSQIRGSTAVNNCTVTTVKLANVLSFLGQKPVYLKLIFSLFTAIMEVKPKSISLTVTVTVTVTATVTVTVTVTVNVTVTKTVAVAFTVTTVNINAKPAYLKIILDHHKDNQGLNHSQPL